MSKVKKTKNRRDIHGVYERRNERGKNYHSYNEKKEKPRIKKFEEKKPGKEQIDQSDRFIQSENILAGRNPVIEALRAGREMERIFIASGSEGSVSVIKALAKEKGIVVDIVDRSRLNTIALGTKHQGVVAVTAAYKYSEMKDIFAQAEKSGEDPLIVLLDEITDPHNLGAVIRTAECAGAHGVVISKRRACGLTEIAAKSSAGAIERIPVVRVGNMGRTVEELKEHGLWIAAADMNGKPYYENDLKGPLAIVIGNEGKGISRLVKEKCDFTVSIPMKGKINSLNASNAAAVLMYAVRRERDLSK